MTRRRIRPSWCVVVGLALPAGAIAQVNPRGNELQVNTYTSGYQGIPSVAADGRRRLRRRLGELRARTARPRRLRPALLERRGSARRASSRSTPTPPITRRSVGGGGRRRRLRRRLESPAGRLELRHLRPALPSAGAPWRSEFQVNTYTDDQQSVPVGGGRRRRRLRRRLGELRNQDGSGNGVFAPTLPSAGAPLAGEFQVNTYTAGYQRYAVGGGWTPTATSSSPGRADGQDGSGYGIFAQRFSSAGTAAGQRVPGQHLHHELPAIRRRWRRTPTATSSSPGRATTRTARAYGVFARRFSSAGAAAGQRVPGQHLHHGLARRPAVATDADGDFVVAWTSYDPGRLGLRRLRPPLLERGRAPRQRVPGQHLHHRTTRTSPTVATAPTATSSSPGRATARTARTTASSPSASPRSATLDIDGNGATRASHRRPPRSAPLVRFQRHHPDHRRRRRRLHALRRGRDRALPRWARPDPRHRRQRLARARSPTASWCCATCSASPARR